MCSGMSSAKAEEGQCHPEKDQERSADLRPEQPLYAEVHEHQQQFLSGGEPCTDTCAPWIAFSSGCAGVRPGRTPDHPMNLTYTSSGSCSSRFSIRPLGTKPAFTIRACDALLDALHEVNSLGVVHAASAAASKPSAAP